MFVGLKCRDAQTHPVISQLMEVTYIQCSAGIPDQVTVLSISSKLLRVGVGDLLLSVPFGEASSVMQVPPLVPSSLWDDGRSSTGNMWWSCRMLALEPALYHKFGTICRHCCCICCGKCGVGNITLLKSQELSQRQAGSIGLAGS